MLRYQSWWSSYLWHNVLGVRKKTFGQLLPIMTNSRLEPGKIQSILTWKILMAEKLPFPAKNHLEILFLLDHVPSQVYLKNCRQLSYISEFYSVSSSVCYWWIKKSLIIISLISCNSSQQVHPLVYIHWVISSSGEIWRAWKIVSMYVYCGVAKRVPFINFQMLSYGDAQLIYEKIYF